MVTILHSWRNQNVTFQEASARLTIVAGKSLGECLSIKYDYQTFKLQNVVIICWVMSSIVFIGNTMYQCNNYAGGVDAVFILPGYIRLTFSLHVGSTNSFFVFSRYWRVNRVESGLLHSLHSDCSHLALFGQNWFSILCSGIADDWDDNFVYHHRLWAGVGQQRLDKVNI